MTSRRSFLAAIAGALVTAKAATHPGILTQDTPEYRRFQMVWEELERACHLTVWDSITIQPGLETQERLFPPPAGAFSLHQIGWHPSAEAKCSDLAAVSRECGYGVSSNRKLVIGGLLCGLPPDGFHRLMRPAAIVPGDDFECNVYCPALPLESPVTISLMLRGLAPWERGAA